MLVLGTGLAFTAIFSVWLENAEANKTETARKHAADLRQTAFEEEFRNAIDGLAIVNRLFSTAGELSRDRFQDAAMQLVERRPYVQSLAFIRVISHEQRAAYEAQMQQFRREFVVTGLKDGRQVPSRTKSRYHVIDYIAPAQSNTAALGLDITSAPGKEFALGRARESGLPSATGLFNLLPEAGSHRVFAVLMPVYRKGTAARNAQPGEDAVTGYTSITLRVSEFVESILHRAVMPHEPDVDISVYVENDSEQELVYRTNSLPGSATDASTLPWLNPNWLATRQQPPSIRSVDIAGMRWHIVSRNSAAAMATGRQGYALLVLAGGSAVSILLALYLQSLALRAADLARANARLKEDIAERERIEDALRKSEERFQRLANLSSDWYWEQDAEFRFTLVSGETIFGGTPTCKLLGRTRWELPLEVDQMDVESHTRLLKERKPFSDLEYRVRDANGQMHWMSVSGEPLFGSDGAFLGYRGAGKDITARKEAEQALRQTQTELRELAAHQERVKEDERKRIAREIHDDLGQNLLALRIDVSLLDEATRHPHPEINKEIRSLMGQVDNVIRSVRAIINDLRPPVLDLGLQSAIEWQVQQFRQRSGVSCTLAVEGGDIDGILDEDAATSVFRILQESLSNVSRHAHAKQVNICVQRRCDRLVLEIADDGIGNYPGNMRKPRSFGLIGIRERVFTLGGEFRLCSAPGKGTSLTISIPVAATSVAAA